MQTLHDSIDSVPTVLVGVCQALRDTIFVPELQEASATRFFSTEHFLIEEIMVSHLPLLSPMIGDSLCSPARGRGTGEAHTQWQRVERRPALVMAHGCAHAHDRTIADRNPPGRFDLDISLQQRGALASLQVVLRSCLEHIHAAARGVVSVFGRPEQMMDRVVGELSAMCARFTSRYTCLARASRSTARRPTNRPMLNKSGSCSTSLVNR